MGKCVSNNIGHPFSILFNGRQILSHNVMLCLNCGIRFLMPHFGRIFDYFWYVLAQLYILVDVIATVMVDVITIC